MHQLQFADYFVFLVYFVCVCSYGIIYTIKRNQQKSIQRISFLLKVANLVGNRGVINRIEYFC
jgi:hypothetical protein